MLCLIVAYKSHRQDQRLESFVWGRPFVTTSVKIAGAQHRHLRRGAAVSATTGRVGSGSLSNGSCARICGNQSHNPQKPTAKEYGKQKTCKQHANNHEQIKGASYTLIEWVCPSGCWRCLCADFVSLRGSKFTSWKTQRVWRIHLPRLRWLALCWLLAQWPVPVTCETGIALGYWPWCHRLRLQHSRRKRSLYVLVTLRISPGHANQIRSTWHQMKRTMPLFGCQLPHMLSSIWCDIFGNDSSCVSTELTFDRWNLPPWCWWQLHARIDIRWGEISSRAGFRVLHKMVASD